jgi:transposase-like protein
MTKNEQNRVLAWRLKLLHEASVMPRNVAQACRHFGLSRQAFYKWKARYKAHGEAGLCDRPRVPLHSPQATPREVISKILFPSAALPLWARPDRRLSAALSPIERCALDRASHSDPSRIEPSAGEPEA